MNRNDKITLLNKARENIRDLAEASDYLETSGNNSIENMKALNISLTAWSNVGIFLLADIGDA